MMLEVKRFIDENRMSLEQFGKLIGVQRSHVSKMINGHRAPSVQLLRKIHDVTKIPAEKLLYECT